MDRHSVLPLVVSVVLLAVAGPAPAQNLDHLKCHKVKDPLRLPPTTADLPAELQPEFGSPGCVVIKPKLFCVPTSKMNVQPAPPRPDITGQGLVTDYICYSIKCPLEPGDRVVTDQFGTRTETKYRSSLLCVPAVKGAATTSTTTTTATTSTTTTTAFPPPTNCCGPEQMVLQSVAGGLREIGPFPPDAFPAGAMLTINSAAGASFPTCTHPAIVPAGGLTVPPFCLAGLGFTAQITTTGCVSGGTDGSGTLWDGGAACPDANVNKTADTSDGVCNPAGEPCNTSSGGAANNTLGNVDAVRGGGPCGASGVHASLDIPVHEIWWEASDFSCPDTDGTFNPPADALVVQFDYLLTLATESANADFVDQNGDSCSYAGAGLSHTKHCSTDPTKPCGTNGVCSPGSCVDGPLVGAPATSACCQLGKTMRLVGAHPTFTGGPTLFDTLLHFSVPMQVTACNPWPGSQSCTLPDSCAD